MQTYCLMGTEFLFGVMKKEKVLELDSGVGCTTS